MWKEIYMYSFISGKGIIRANLFSSSSPWQMFFQDSASPVMEGIINLHHDLMFFLTFIFFFVLVVLGRTLYYFQYSSTNDDIQSRSVVHGTLIELIWTIVPSLILIVVALPSFALLYSIDEVIDPSLTIKCVGHQWYWSMPLNLYSHGDFYPSFSLKVRGKALTLLSL